MNTTLINIFKERIMEETGSFTIGCKEKYGSTRYYEFMQRTVDEARFVYLSSNFRESDRYSYNQKFDLAAIVVDEKIYLVDTFTFRNSDGKDYPDDVFALSDECTSIKAYIQRQMQKLIEGKLVEPYSTGLNERVYIDDCMKEARKNILKGTKPKCYFDFKIDTQDIVNVICKFQRVNNLIDDIINGVDKPYYQFVAWEYNKIRELMESEIVEEWENELAECLRESSAKNVNVKFEVNGKTETVKIDRETVLRSLIYSFDFSYYNFECSSDKGRKVLENLGISYPDKLGCKHITEITFGRKTLYKRENN